MRDPQTNPRRLDHENLAVYRCAIEFLSLLSKPWDSLPRGAGEVREQLKRAAISIVLNIAEGVGSRPRLITVDSTQSPGVRHGVWCSRSTGNGCWLGSYRC